MRSSLLAVVLLWLLSAPMVLAAPAAAVVRPAERHDARRAAWLDEKLTLNGEAVAPVAPWAAPLIPQLPADWLLLSPDSRWAAPASQPGPRLPAAGAVDVAQMRRLRASVVPQAP